MGRKDRNVVLAGGETCPAEMSPSYAEKPATSVSTFCMPPILSCLSHAEPTPGLEPHHAELRSAYTSHLLGHPSLRQPFSEPQGRPHQALVNATHVCCIAWESRSHPGHFRTLLVQPSWSLLGLFCVACFGSFRHDHRPTSKTLFPVACGKRGRTCPQAGQGPSLEILGSFFFLFCINRSLLVCCYLLGLVPFGGRGKHLSSSI